MTESWVEPELAFDDPYQYVVLALDPGGTTGWSVFGVHEEAMTGDPGLLVLENVLWWTAGEFTGKQDDQIDAVVDLVEAWPSARLVTEAFRLRQLNALLDPVEINAAVRWATRPRRWVQQHPGLAMSTVTDDRQKSWGFWLPGKEHARDAVKHAITYLKREKESAVAAARRVTSLSRV